MAEKNVIFQKFEGAQIWTHYKRSNCGKFEECHIWTKILKCDGGSTKGLHVYLKSVHNIDLMKRKIGEIYRIIQIVPSIPGLNAIPIPKSRDWKKAPRLGPLIGQGIWPQHRHSPLS